MASTILALWCGSADGDGDHSARPEASSSLKPTSVATQAADPDATLIVGLRARETAALDALMRQYAPQLLRFAYGYVHDRSVARDIVQDVFVSLWELDARLNVTGTIRGYLYAAVRNRALDVHKHDVRMQRFEQVTIAEQEIPAMGGPPRRADDQVLIDERLDMLRRAVAALPGRWRQAVVLRIEDQLDYDEIAHALGVSAGAARKLVERAQRELRRMLAPYLDG